MKKIKDRVFDVIIILGLVFLIMQISVITSEKKNDIQVPAKESVQNTPPSSNEVPDILPDENKKQVSTEEEQKKDNSIDL